MILTLRSVSLGFILLGTVLAALPVEAQTPRPVTRPPGELLAAFAGEYQTPGS